VHFRQFYVGCLAHASYLIGDGDEAVVVDPSRDIEPYLEEAAAHGLTIRWVLETHLHADFVSGHMELAARTGATIALGARAEAGFPHRALGDGDTIAVGDARIRAVETPGHTPESLTFLVYEHASDAEPWAALTGDTLFVGDVGRVDILSSRLPVDELAGMMYDSLHQRLLTLPDTTRVYPAHGAGSLCGRGISSERWSTIGQERMMNPALRPMTREAFIAEVTRDVPETPVYFLHSRDLNRDGPPVRGTDGLPPALDAAGVARAVAAGAMVIDTRPAADYAAAHPTGALYVGLDGQYASWVGTLVDPDRTIVLVTEPDRAAEAIMRLARVGYENVAGTLGPDPALWRAAGLDVTSLADETSPIAVRAGRRVLDVRRAREWDAGHVAGATHLPLSELGARASELDRDAEWVMLCASGYRSLIAASVLERAGFRRLVNAAGGMDAWRAAGLPLEAGSPI
jgi:glyoxylase-like metal-dependent hydrolase (beta-lactamase superfamily II)/rhodanese-related sulfurtransferase